MEGSMKRIASRCWPLALLLLLGGCGSAQTASEPTRYVGARGNDLSDAQRLAVEKAEAQCPAGEPVVSHRAAQPATPTFATPLPASPPQSEASDLAAATHEGESPTVRLGFHCD